MALTGKTEIKVTASDALEFEPVASAPEKSGWFLKLFMIVLVVAGVGGGIVFFGDQLTRMWGSVETGIPLIKAAKGPVKVRPDNPGGLRVPDRDKLVYGRIQEGKTGEGDSRGPERLLPPPEKLLPKPTKTAKPPVAEKIVSAKPAESKKSVLKGPEKAKPVAKVPTVKDVVTAKRPAPPPPPQAPSATANSTSPFSSSAKSKPQPVTPKPVAPKKAPPQKAPVPMKPASVAPSSTAPSSTAPSPPAPVADKGAPVAIPRSKAYLIQLAAARSPQGARTEWARIRTKNLDLLGNLGLTVTKADLGPAKGIFYRLRAGPFAEEGAARKLCRQLAERQIGCLVIRPEKK
ncbi:MAG: SPOR domain-containing protein [Rhodospirillales bacterium]|nr:SPOR domain-containing protein [Rhodospirillales bacterium]